MLYNDKKPENSITQYHLLQSLRKSRLFTRNSLKLIAVFSMFIDHIGLHLLPHITVFRIIGRLAFPIFAFFIYEGFCHTRNRIRYLLRISALGIVCTGGYYIYSGIIHLNVLLTFTLSIIILFILRFTKECLVNSDRKGFVLSVSVLIAGISAIAAVTGVIDIEYGFEGVMLAVAPEFVSNDISGGVGKISADRPMKLFAFSFVLMLLALQLGGIQIYSLFALPLLALYNGEKGRHNINGFFYWFYPAHLIIIGFISAVV